MANKTVVTEERRGSWRTQTRTVETRSFTDVDGTRMVTKIESSWVEPPCSVCKRDDCHDSHCGQ